MWQGEQLEGETEAGPGGDVWDPQVPVLMELHVAVWAGEEGTEPEEEEVEEEEESGSLNEEEIKKMQSDEVCRGQPRAPSAVSTVSPQVRAWGHFPGFCACPPLLHPPLSSLGHSGPGGDSL